MIAVYQDIKQRTLSQHDVFRDDITSCTSEHARYVHPIVPVERNLVSNEFSHDVCKLPLTYDRDSYRSFLDRWGTVRSLISEITPLSPENNATLSVNFKFYEC